MGGLDTTDMVIAAHHCNLLKRPFYIKFSFYITCRLIGDYPKDNKGHQIVQMYFEG